MSELSRVTLNFPKNLWEEVKQTVPPGERSRLIVEAVEAEMRRRKRLEQVEELKKLHAYMKNKYGELPSSVEDIAEMREERDYEITGLR